MRKEMKNKNMEEANKLAETKYQKDKDLNGVSPKLLKKVDPVKEKDIEDEDTKKEDPKNASNNTKGAVSGDSDVRSPTSTDVRSPTSTETSTDAYTSGNVTVTGGAGAGADTTVNISSPPEKYKRLKTPPAKRQGKSALSEELDEMRRIAKMLLR